MKKTNFTPIGLVIAYSSLTGISQLFKSVFPNPLTDALVIFRELMMLGMVGLLFWLILKKEKLPLSSIGLGSHSWKQTALWSVLTFAISLVGIFGALAMVKGLGMTYGESQTMSKLSTSTLALVCLRAGVAEEVFFRGYIYERLATLTQNKGLAVALSVIPFALCHFSQGLAGMLIAFVGGSILTATYLWKKNLTSNIIAHFAIDFIGNVIG